MLDDTLYYLRGFAKNNSYITYGRVVSFKIMGSPSPEILDFQPEEGYGGTHISITGKNFSSRLTGNKVTLGPYTAIINQASNTELFITLPDNVTISGPTHAS